MSYLTDSELLELHELLDALVENNLPKDKLLRLEEWIAENENVRMHYIEFMDMNSSLHHYAEELVSDDTESAIEEDDKVLYWKPILSIAAILALGLFFIQAFQNNSTEINSLKYVENSSTQDLESSSNQSIIVDSVAVLTKSVGVTWEQGIEFRPNLGRYS